VEDFATTNLVRNGGRKRRKEKQKIQAVWKDQIAILELQTSARNFALPLPMHDTLILPLPVNDICAYEMWVKCQNCKSQCLQSYFCKFLGWKIPIPSCDAHRAAGRLP